MDTQTIGQWIILGIIIAVLAFDKVSKLKLFKNSNNPGYGERIAGLETDMKNVKEDIIEIKVKLNKK